MKRKSTHPDDQELLQSLDGELSYWKRRRVQAHLDSCWACRARKVELESTIAAYVTSQEGQSGTLPAIDGSRALLKSRLAEAARATDTLLPARMLPAIALATLVLLAAFFIRIHYSTTGSPTVSNRWTAGPSPSASLTPGAVALVSKAELCSANYASGASTIPVAMQKQVFEEYGMPNARAANYEVDYLITPELGGATDVRNLWPQPYHDAVWNAHVKDQLEDLLHNMVCKDRVDLMTAQREIATDWIGAYKKYFRTERPLKDVSDPRVY